MTGFDEAEIRRFESWADYNSAVDTDFRYDPQRETIGYDAAGVGMTRAMIRTCGWSSAG